MEFWTKEWCPVGGSAQAKPTKCDPNFKIAYLEKYGVTLKNKICHSKEKTMNFNFVLSTILIGGPRQKLHNGAGSR